MFVLMKKSVGELASGLVGTSGVLNTLEITQSFNHNKSSSISQLLKGKSRDL